MLLATDPLGRASRIRGALGAGPEAPERDHQGSGVARTPSPPVSSCQRLVFAATTLHEHPRVPVHPEGSWTNSPQSAHPVDSWARPPGQGAQLIANQVLPVGTMRGCHTAAQGEECQV